MKQYYHIGGTRIVNSANHNVYVNGVLHPDRIMKEHDFVYIEEGFWEIYQNGHAYKLSRDDVIILHAGERHYGLNLCDPHTKTMYFHVNCHPTDQIGDGGEIDPESRVILDTVIHCRNNPKIKAIFNDIVYAYLSGTFYKEAKISSLFYLLLFELYDCSGPANTDRLNLADQAVHIIQQNPQKFFTGKELSEKLFVCERTLMKRFKIKYGKSIYSYQADMKLEAVRLFLLNHPDIKLREAALNFGFYDEFHLSKAFKKKFHISPKQYRLNAGQSIAGIREFEPEAPFGIRAEKDGHKNEKEVLRNE